MNGQLSEQPLAELIRELTAASLSGALRLARERVQAVVYVQSGALIHARSNLRAHRLPESLCRWGFMTTEQLAAFGNAAMTEPEICAALVSADVIKQAELPGLRLRQAADVLRPLLLWTDGTWSFDPRARLAEESDGSIEPAELLLEGARRLPARFAAARLADDDMLAPVNAPPTHLSLLPTEAFILSRVDAPLRLTDLVAVSGLPETETRHTVYALALAGLIARADWPIVFDKRALARAATNATGQTTADAMQAQPTPPNAAHKTASSRATTTPEQTTAEQQEADPQAEIATLLARVRAANFYELLGVARHAQADEIKRAYYALAKRFHPDRFRRVADEKERGRIEAAFARIAHAYETLSDDKTRATYDAKLGLTSVPVAATTPQDATPVMRASAEENFQHGLAALKVNNHRMAAAYSPRPRASRPSRRVIMLTMDACSRTTRAHGARPRRSCNPPSRSMRPTPPISSCSPSYITRSISRAAPKPN